MTPETLNWLHAAAVLAYRLALVVIVMEVGRQVKGGPFTGTWMPWLMIAAFISSMAAFVASAR